MANIEQKIKEIIDKIDENLKKSLDEEEVQTLLYEIDDELAEIKKSAEKNQKEVVDEKVKELKDKVNKGIENEWGWTRVKKTLEKDIKNGLNELKKEITELEKPVAAIPIIVEHKPGGKDNTYSWKWGNLGGGLEELKKKMMSSGETSTPVIDDLEKELAELAEWRKVFAGQSPEEAGEMAKKMLQGLLDYKKNSDELQKDLIEMAKKSDSTDFLEFGDRLTKRGIEVGQTCSDIGKDVMPLVGHAAGTWLGAAAGSAVVWAGTAGYFADKGINTWKELVEETGGGVVGLAKEGIGEIGKARKDAKEFAEHMADNARDLMKEGMDDMKDVITENIKVAQEAVKGGMGAKIGGVELGINMGRGNVLQEEVKGKEEKIKLLQEELNNKKAEIEKLTKAKDKELEEKNKRIRELEKEQAIQQEKKDEAQKFLTTEAIGAIKEVAIGSRPGSPAPSMGGNDEEITRLREELVEKKKEHKEQLAEKKKELEKSEQKFEKELEEKKQEIKELKQSQQTARIEVPTN